MLHLWVMLSQLDKLYSIGEDNVLNDGNLEECERKQSRPI